MHVLTEVDPVAVVRAEARPAVRPPLPVRLRHWFSRVWCKVAYG